VKIIQAGSGATGRGVMNLLQRKTFAPDEQGWLCFMASHPFRRKERKGWGTV
jgi:hypothetical protein